MERMTRKAIQCLCNLNSVLSAPDDEISKEELGCEGGPCLADETGRKHGVRGLAVSVMKGDSVLICRVRKESWPVVASISTVDMRCVVKDPQPYFWGKFRFRGTTSLANVRETEKPTQGIHSERLVRG